MEHDLERAPRTHTVSPPPRPGSCERRRAADLVNRLVAQWNANAEVRADEASAAVAQAARCSDKLLHARASLLAAETADGQRAPAGILLCLNGAIRVFVANHMVKERQFASIAATRQLIRAGHPGQALQWLAEAEAVQFDTAEMLARRSALRAQAEMDLGQAVDAARSARLALDLLGSTRVGPRAGVEAASHCAEVLVGLRLLAAGIETHLTLYLPQSAADGAAALASLSAGSTAPATEWLVSDGRDSSTLWLLQQAATRPCTSALLLEMATWVSRMAADGDAAEQTGNLQAWIRLGSAYRLTGHLRPAIDCLRRALSLARAAGQARLARQARFELSRALAANLEFAEAYRVMSELQAESVGRLITAPSAKADGEAASALTDTDDEAQRDLGVAARHVRRAQLVIAERLGESLAVSKLAAQCGVSRRTLEVAFREVLHTTVAGCVRDQRLREVKHRLLHTNQPIKRIAQDLGYSAATSLSREFRRATELSPEAFRRRAVMAAA